jgi:hypothetical protein
MEEYITPEIKVIEFETKDVIVTSGDKISLDKDEVIIMLK